MPKPKITRRRELGAGDRAQAQRRGLRAGRHQGLRASVARRTNAALTGPIRAPTHEAVGREDRVAGRLRVRLARVQPWHSRRPEKCHRHGSKPTSSKAMHRTCARRRYCSNGIEAASQRPPGSTPIGLRVTRRGSTRARRWCSLSRLPRWLPTGCDLPRKAVLCCWSRARRGSSSGAGTLDAAARRR